MPIRSSSPRTRGPSAFALALRWKRKALGPRFRGDDGGFVWMRKLLMVVALLATSTLAHAIDPLPFKDRAEELRFQALTKVLRCLVCQNENLADSNAPLAVDLRRDVFEQMQAGKSDDEIKAWLTARYSDFVLYDPPLRASTMLLWFGPFVVLIAGGIAVAFAVRRRAQMGALSNVPAPATRPAGGGEEDW
jgi:cytochrome c-type biogenesis protein CcmH